MPFVRAGGERRLSRWRLSAFTTAILLFVVGAGALIGNQIINPAKRVIEAVAGALLVYVLWSNSTINALWILLVIYPFPFAIVVGNSTFVFVIAMFLICLIRASARIATFRLDRAFNLPIALFMMSYMVSFYNLSTEQYALRFALVHTGSVIACVLLFYMIINFVDTEKRLETAMRVMMITAAAVISEPMVAPT